MPELIEQRCPRCGGIDIRTRTCQSCRISLDTDKAFEPHTREHTMVAKRYEHWTLEKRRASLAATERRLLGL